jgi:hypothetical protein
MGFNDTIIGLVIGALFTSIAFIYKKRLENISILKRSLYQLLILYRSVNASMLIKPSELSKLVIDVLYELFPESKEGNDLDGAEDLYTELLSPIFNLATTDQNLVPMYLEAVACISPIDPVLAFRLSGNAKLKDYPSPKANERPVGG